MTAMPDEAFEWQYREDHEELPGPLDEFVLPYGSSGWKYLNVPLSDTTNRAATAFDDSSWSTGSAPFGLNDHTGLAWPAPVTPFPLQTRTWVRRHVAAYPSVPIILEVRYDNIAAVYWNGTLLHTAGSDTSNPDTVTVPVRGSLVLADNVLAIRFSDDSGTSGTDGTYGDVRVEQVGAEAYAPPVGPVARWKLDETSGTTAADSAAGTYPGTFVGSPTLNQTGIPSGGKSVLFASGKYVNMGNVLAMAGAKAISVAGWIKLPAGWGGGGSFTPMIAKGNNAWRLGRNGTTSGVQWNLTTGSTSATVSVTTPVDDGQWHRLFGTYDGNKVATDRVRLYIDGILVGTNSGTIGLPSTTDPVRIASRSDNGALYFPGYIDEVNVYDREVSAREVAIDYARGIEAYVPVVPDPEPIVVHGWFPDADRSHALAVLSLSYGRSDAHSRCRPLQANVTMAAELAGECPPSGERFRLALSEAAAMAIGLEPGHPLFTGEVTDPEIDPDAGVYDLTGVGRLGRGSRRTLRTEDWRTELDGARVERVLDRAGLDGGTIDPGTALLIAPDGNASVGNLLETVTDSTGGSLVEQPDGTVDYHDADHRRGTPVTVTLTAGQIDNRVQWRQSVDDLLNELTVAWAGGAVVARDAGSILTRGEFPGQITTALATASDAHSLGQRIVARRSEPVWQLPNLEVDLMRMVDGPLRAQLLGLRHGDRIKVTGIPLAHPYTGDVEFFVEGWKMRLDRPIKDQPWRWKLTLAVSDPAFSGVSLRWTDLPEGLAWNELDPGMSWLDLTRIEDPADL